MSACGVVPLKRLLRHGSGPWGRTYIGSLALLGQREIAQMRNLGDHIEEM